MVKKVSISIVSRMVFSMVRKNKGRAMWIWVRMMMEKCFWEKKIGRMWGLILVRNLD